MTALHDMHCHLDFVADSQTLAADARAAGTLLFANTVTPAGYEAAVKQFAGFDNVRVGFGMHPWWTAGEPAQEPPSGRRAGSQRAARREEAEAAARRDGLSPAEQSRQAEVMALLEALNPPLIGEVGLDFGWRHQGSRLAQTALFESIARWAAGRGGKLISLHSIKAARETLEVLDRTGALESCDCVFHWFSGPSDLLKQAIEQGCYFSCGTRMLKTGKGREYVKAIPARQLLLETDAPPERGEAYPYVELRAELERVAEGIAAIKGAEALDAIAESSEALLDR